MKTQLTWLLLGFLTSVGCKKSEPSESNKPAAAKEAADHDEGEGGEKQRIQLTQTAVESAQLQLARAESKNLADGIALPARIVFPQDGVTKISARVPGRVSTIDVKLGQAVAANAMLGHIESPELAQVRAEYLSTETKARVARADYEREKSLLEKGITSEREMRQAESAYVSAQAERNAADARLHTLGLSEEEISAIKRQPQHSSRFPLRTPIAGTVVEVLVGPGQSVESSTPLFTVGDLGTLWALLDAPESQVAKLKAGQPAEISVTGLAGRRFVGTVDYVGDLVEEKTRTIPVRVVVPNADRALKPGMFASALVSVAGGEAPAPAPGDAAAKPTVVVPREAVQSVESGTVVFKPVGNNAFEAVRVQVGATTATHAELLSGLEAGTEVVTRGAFILKSELSKESLGEGHAH